MLADNLTRGKRPGARTGTYTGAVPPAETPGVGMTRTARILLIALLIASLQGCCHPSSASGAAKARALTQKQLEMLYTQMERYKDEHTFIVWGEGFIPLPGEFAQAGALHGEAGGLNRLVFGGCRDDKASLFFSGLRGNGPKEIVLIPGEWQDAEVLWRASGETSAMP